MESRPTVSTPADQAPGCKKRGDGCATRGQAVRSPVGRGPAVAAGSALEQKHQIALFVFDLVSLGLSDLRTLNCVLGAFPHLLGHRPPLMCVFHRIYKWKATLEEGVVYESPGDIRDELLIAVLLLGLADAHIRAPFEGVLRATDTKPSAYGSCSAPCSGKLLRGLYRTRRHRGEAGGLVGMGTWIGFRQQ